MSLHVLEPGLATWVVDAGREKYRSLGVPVGGAADRASLALGNGLVGNPPDAAALEINLSGPTLRAGCTLACVLYGAPFEMASDRQRLHPGRTFTLQPEETLSIHGTPTGMRAYLCVQGGIRIPPVLESRSSLRPIEVGAELPCEHGNICRRFLAENPLGEEDHTTLRVLPGPHADWFPGQEMQGRSFLVKPASDRMGLRLEGDPFRLPGRQLVSEPVCPGSVQVTGDGQCIVLGVDGQTIGGYPKISQVITADMDKLGRLRPGEVVRFRTASLAEATTANRQRQTLLRRWLLRLHVTAPGVGSLARPEPPPTKDRGNRTRDETEEFEKWLVGFTTPEND
jgi:antagonist of KipI